MSFDGVKIVFKKIIFVSAALLISANLANAAPDSKGTDFWLTFPGNLIQQQLTLFIAGDIATTGTVTGPGMAPTNFSVTPGVVSVVNIPPSAQLATSDTVEHKGIHVTAQAEVTVYGLNRATFTTDAYLGLPTDILGTEYIVLGYSGSSPEFAIVATVDTTTVTITPSATAGSRPAGVPFDINLNQGQTYQLRGSADLSGSLVTSDKPIAVFGGTACANIPPGIAFCDHVVEQLPPTETWGKSFVTIPLATRDNGDTFRFLASTNGTTISVNGTVVTPVPLNRGQFHERIINSSAVITSDQPILVAQYSNSCQFDSPCGPADGDPFMMLIPPFEQFLGQYTVSTPDEAGDTTPQFPANFVNVVAPSAAVGAITLDGTAIPPASFTAIGSSGFSGAQVPLSQGSHSLSGPLPFGAFIYGFGSFDSYGYPGGLSLAPVARVTGLSLAPKTATNPVGTQHCLVATVTDQNNEPLEGVRVDFNVSGANPMGGFTNTDANGQAQFCYTGENPGLDTIEASVGDIADTATKTWTPEGNTPPVAIPPPPVTTDEDTPKTISLSGSDADEDSLTFRVVTLPQHGVLGEPAAATKAQLSRVRRQLKARLRKEGKLTAKEIAAILQSTSFQTRPYAPEPNYFGPDSFTFVVNDGKVDSAPATVNITVTPVNDPPVLLDGEFDRRTSPTAGYSYSTPGIAAVLKFLDVDGGDPSVGLTVTSLKAKNVPKGCGAHVFPSDEVTLAPPNFSESVSLVGDPDFEDSARVKGEIKTVEIGPAAMNAAAAQGCHVTLMVTDFSVFRTGDDANKFSGTACIDSDTNTVKQPCSSAATLVSRRTQTGSSGLGIKIAPPRVR
jgi:hypothetical protein